MSTKGSIRGNKTEFKDGVWIFSDTGEPTAQTHKSRSCGQCKKHPIKDRHEEYDACMGRLPRIKNACCGHGNTELASIQFMSGFSVHGPDATKIINILKNKLS